MREVSLEGFHAPPILTHHIFHPLNLALLRGVGDGGNVLHDDFAGFGFPSTAFACSGRQREKTGTIFQPDKTWDASSFALQEGHELLYAPEMTMHVSWLRRFMVR